MSERPSVLFYCQHSVGLGHLTRSYALCERLAEHFRVVLVCGGTLPDAVPPPTGVEIVALPPVGVDAEGAFVSHQADLTLDRAWTLRRELLLNTVRTLRPASVLVELFPFGRARFARELLPLLEEARRAGAFAACSLRDILVSRRANQRAHDERACAIANAYLDAVLVHCDPRFARLEETFAPRARLRVPVHYTGFVAGKPVAPTRREDHVMVSAGGGLVGEPLLRTALEAQRILRRRSGLRMRVVGGPFLPERAWDRLRAAAERQSPVELVRTVPDLADELRRAAASVSQCGYNTALDLVRAGVPALVVPYATTEEDEQRRRARRLRRLGLVRVLEPERLEPATLAREILRLGEFEPQRAQIDLDGAATTCRLLREAPHLEARSA
jgi:predicted glycosyltransferase